MFEEKLINAVFKHKCLWHKSTILYRNRVEREKAWRNIARIVQESEQNCKKRWKSLRDRFVIEYNSLKETNGCPTDRKKTWQLFNSLLFLKNEISPRQNSSNLNLNTAETIEYTECASITPPITSTIHIKSLDNLQENTYCSTVKEESSNQESFYASNCNQTISSDHDLTQNKPSTSRAVKQKRKIKDNLNKLINKIDLFEETKKSKQDAILNVIQEYIDQVDENYKMDFKYEILSYVHHKFNEYKNKE